MRFLALVMAVWASLADSAPVSGRYWRVDLKSIDCEPVQSVIVIGTAVRYIGPKGAVEAPLAYLSDAQGRQLFPQGLAWQRGSKTAADWFSGGGVINVQTEDIGEVRMRFDVREAAAGDLLLEFGDVKPFAVRRGGSACKGILAPAQVQAPRARGKGAASGVRIHRARYPCSPSGSVEAEQPPYPPVQMLVLGRGHLPNARSVELPSGRVPAQSYAYTGADELDAIEKFAREAIAADFPALSAAKHFAFNWGVQRGRSGNQLDSIAIYELRACPR